MEQEKARAENKENIEKNNTTDTSKNIENTEIGTTKKDYDEGKKVLVNVFSVVDGDTLKVTLNNEKYTVRLVGVDTPESVHPNKEKNTVEGKIASDYKIRMYMYKKMYQVQIDIGRLLSYVYLEDGTMYNQELLEEGYAKVLKIAPDVKYHKTFEIIQNKAKEEKKGIWK